MNRKATAAARINTACRSTYLFMRADGAQLAEVARLVESGTIQPIIDKVFPLAQTSEALAYNETGRTVGKVVIEVPTDQPCRFT